MPEPSGASAGRDTRAGGVGSRYALIVATDHYQDRGFADLRSVQEGVAQLAAVLADPAIGGWDVQVLLNEPRVSLVGTLGRCFEDCTEQDSVLVYWCGHSAIGRTGSPTFVVTDTSVDAIEATALPFDFIGNMRRTSRARQVLMLIDCGLSSGWTEASGRNLFQPPGIYTTSPSTEVIMAVTSNTVVSAQEPDSATVGPDRPEVFLHTLLEGVGSGAADRDGDGLVSSDELFGYTIGRMRELAPQQSLERATNGSGEPFIVARSGQSARSAHEDTAAPTAVGGGGYVARVLYQDGRLAGTCFQVSPGLLVTCHHLMATGGSATEGSLVWVDQPPDATRISTRVARVDEEHDLVILAADAHLPQVSGPLVQEGDVGVNTPVTVVGPSSLGIMVGIWVGTTTGDSVSRGLISMSGSPAPGISGAPVVRSSDGAVVGVMRTQFRDNLAVGPSLGVVLADDVMQLLTHYALDVAELMPSGEESRIVADLIELFERNGDLDVLDQAQEILRRGLQRTAGQSPDPLLYSQLGLVLRLIFARTGDLTLLRESAGLERQAVALVPPSGDPRLPDFMASLAQTLRLYADLTGELESLHESIELLRGALDITELGDARRPALLHGLGLSLKTDFERTGYRNALEEAVAVFRDAAAVATAGSRQIVEYLCNLGLALLLRLGATGDARNLLEAADVSQSAGSGNDAWVSVVQRAESLRAHVNYPLLATEQLLWVLHEDPSGPTRALVHAAIGQAEAEAELDGLVQLEDRTDFVVWGATPTEAPPSFLLAGLDPTANMCAVLAHAATAASAGRMPGAFELLAGLAQVPDCVATRWLVRTCGLPAHRLHEIVMESAGSQESLSELVRRARQEVRYALHLDLSADEVGLGGVVDVFAHLELATDPDDLSGFVLDADSASTELSILLQAPGFRIEGEDAAALSIDPRDADVGRPSAQSAMFQLTPLRPGPGTIRAAIFRGPDFATVLERVLTVTEEQPSLGTMRPTALRKRPLFAADLMLEIRADWQSGRPGCTLAFRLTSSRAVLGLGEGLEFRSEQLPTGWLDRVRGLLAATIVETADTAADDARARLASFGQYLGELAVPSDLRAELASLGRARTLQLVADEDVWAPWELMHDGTAFLAERYVIGRWPRELDSACPHEVPIGQVSVAYYHGVDYPSRWVTLLQPVGAPAPTILPGGVLRDVAATQSLHGLHLLRQTQPDHEVRRDAPAIAGYDEQSQLSQATLTVRRERPLVTLGYVRKNGGALAALEQTWAMGFLRARCSAFSGPLWAVDPAVDAAFTARLYERLWAGSSVGEAFHAARALARLTSPVSLDWLAYVLFADPTSRPYRPVEGTGYTAVERVGADLDVPLRPGETARFRASLRRTPPIWHEDRVLEVVSEFAFTALELYVLPSGVEAAPTGPILLSRTSEGDYQGWFTLTAPLAPSEDPAFAQVYFVDKRRPVHSLTVPVVLQKPGGERQ